MCPMSYVVQKAGRSNCDHFYGFLNHIGHRAHRFHIGFFNQQFINSKWHEIIDFFYSVLISDPKGYTYKPGNTSHGGKDIYISFKLFTGLATAAFSALYPTVSHDMMIESTTANRNIPALIGMRYTK